MELNPKNNYRIVDIRTISDLKAHWNFFIEGLMKLNSKVDTEHRMSFENFMKYLLDVLSRGEQHGRVFVVLDKKPLVFGILANNSSLYHKPSVLYHAYTNGFDSRAPMFALEEAQTWAKKHGYAEIQTFSPRTSGSSFHLYEKKWKFRRQYVMFAKPL
jgi:hypothetical protein